MQYVICEHIIIVYDAISKMEGFVIFYLITFAEGSLLRKQEILWGNVICMGSVFLNPPLYYTCDKRHHLKAFQDLLI